MECDNVLNQQIKSFVEEVSETQPFVFKVLL